MQWGQIKTLFIICFLILDIFLAQQFMQKQKQSEYGLLDDSTIEEQLEAEDITLGDLPKENVKQAYISAKRHTFSLQEQEEQKEKLENQEYEVFNGDILISTFKEPIPIDLEAPEQDLASKVKNQVLYGDRYTFWSWNEKSRTLLFFQNYKEKPIYFNENAIIIAFLNEDNELISYAQTMLDNIHSTGEAQELIKPIHAVETLYTQNQLYSGDRVNAMNLGYHTLVPLANGVQVFSPTWKINVNEKRNHFVNGVEGQLISTDESQFVNETINKISEQIESISWSGE
ncbi:transcriptional regulator [Pontibacillus yanchengensis]|uniref:Transcriptional regulator n=2 Tax=Pontibacillus yanchengensis TaxID=462910 RepID=A0ACC7VFN5_9BACI|nr:two-component system regulatory protein YycI [Pontibacillus yanchengensis]MYL34460.1 transcriptional regulator [Pontibacillus yanchengensis]MYL54268.1 transcriptional regulator [Pontibacillus yanchengensis]